ncbi:MAG: GNAT family N-acetyltransferase [Candidatus Coproplasma sp.]
MQFTIRKMAAGDDLEQVARLIYLTDPYIYPNWFDSMEDGVKVIREMIELPTLYNRENITVAVLPDGFIAGMVVSKQTPFVEDEEYISQAFRRAKVQEDKRTKEVFDAYYSKMGGEEDGYYVANAAVDPAYRKQGIAGALIESVTEGKDFCSLECVVANAGAWRLYQRLGFKIEYEYPGVHGIPCYKMTLSR